MSNSFLPNNPQQFPLRPLDKGMILNKPSQTIPPTACIDAQNYIITSNGPRRRPGYEPYGSTTASYASLIKLPYKFIDLFTFWTTGVGALDRELLLITDGGLYKVGIGGLSEVEWVYNTGTASVTDNVVTGIGTDFLAADIYPMDIFRINGEEARISEIVDATTINLVAGGVTNTVATSYEIQRAFNTDPTYLCDYTIKDNEVIFTDLNAPLVVYKYDNPAGSQMELFIQDDAYKIDEGNGPEDFIANAITVFQDRIFCGYIISPTDGIRRQRIRWSKVTNPRDFSEPTAYIDLPYSQGAIQRLVPLGNTLIVYMSDAVYIGLPTNNPDLPVAFQKVETGNIGLVGKKAIVSFVDGHFFVGQDDIFFSTTSGTERIGSSVVKRTIKESTYRERIYAAPDFENERVVFGFTKDSDLMEELWSFCYKTKGWSYDPVSSYMIANPLLSLDLSWSDLAGYTWDDVNPINATFPTWDSMVLKENAQHFFIETNGFLRQLSVNGRVDKLPDNLGSVIETPIVAVYETGDFDFDDPDVIKTFLRISLKVDFEIEPNEDVLFAVQGSWNRGRSWKALGTLRIKNTYDEGYINFLLTSSHVRFKFTCSNAIAPFTITEAVLKVRTRGEELSLGVQAP